MASEPILNGSMVETKRMIIIIPGAANVKPDGKMRQMLGRMQRGMTQ